MTEQTVAEVAERQPRGNESAAKRATLHRYRVALVLLVVAVAFGVTAKEVLPSSSPVFVHGAIQRITVTGNLMVSGVDLNETPLPDGMGVTLEVTLRAPEPQLRTRYERLVVAVPDSSKTGEPCPKGALSCRPPVAGVRTIYVRFPDREWTNTGTSGALPYRFEAPGADRPPRGGVEPRPGR